MAISVTCQRCGNTVGADATHGLCPACLLEQGLRDSRADAVTSEAAIAVAAELRELGRLFPQLEVMELLGRGGMGVVYKARQRGLDRLVALKILPPGVDRDPGFQERFVREARALARLNHPNIVAVYDFGQVEGRYFFLMEYVDGVNLRRMLQGGHLTPQQAMGIVPQLCDALQFAHEEGIVHRDIKPENILVDRKGRVKVADFGLAKLLTGSVQQDPYTLTAPRQVLGTPHYMAPEQLERPGTVDHRADIYSMGVVFYEMLTGELPLGRFPPPSRKVQVDVRLDEVVLRTLEKEPEQRYQRAGEVKTELATLASAPAGSGPPTLSATRAPRVAVGSAPRLSRLAVAGLIVALIPLFIVPGLAIFEAVQAATATSDGMSLPPMLVPVSLTAAIVVVAVIGAVLSCWLGIAAVRGIRRSRGQLWGLGLALFDALAYPLVVMDVVIVAVCMFLLQPQNEPADRIALLLFLLTILLDVYIYRRMLRWISRPHVEASGAFGPMGATSRPAHPPANYALPPRRHGGCLIAVGIVAVVALGLILLAVASVGWYRFHAVPASAVLAQRSGYVVAEPTDNGVPPRAAHDYRFVVNSPPNTKTVVWAEIWRDGKIEPTPGFAVTQWAAPPAGRSFVGTVTLQLGAPRPDGQIDAAWDIAGGDVSSHAEHLIPDPLEGTTVNDTTWGPWGGSWSPMIGQRQQILCIRGFRPGAPRPQTPTDQSAVGRSAGEIRVYVRFDPIATPNLNPGLLLGESQAVPNASTRPIEADPEKAIRDRLRQRRAEDAAAPTPDDGSEIRERLLRRRMEVMGHPATEPAGRDGK